MGPADMSNRAHLWLRLAALAVIAAAAFAPRASAVVERPVQAATQTAGLGAVTGRGNGPMTGRTPSAPGSGMSPTGAARTGLAASAQRAADEAAAAELSVTAPLTKDTQGAAAAVARF